MEVRGNERFAVYERPGNVQIISITDNNGRLLRRVRRGPDGRECRADREPAWSWLRHRACVSASRRSVSAPSWRSTWRHRSSHIPRERYIVDLDVAPPDLLYETLAAPPLMAIERPYTLDEIRYNVELRDRMRRIDINTITFDNTARGLSRPTSTTGSPASPRRSGACRNAGPTRWS